MLIYATHPRAIYGNKALSQSDIIDFANRMIIRALSHSAHKQFYKGSELHSQIMKMFRPHNDLGSLLMTSFAARARESTTVRDTLELTIGFALNGRTAHGLVPLPLVP